MGCLIKSGCALILTPDTGKGTNKRLLNMRMRVKLVFVGHSGIIRHLTESVAYLAYEYPAHGCLHYRAAVWQAGCKSCYTGVCGMKLRSPAAEVAPYLCYLAPLLLLLRRWRTTARKVIYSLFCGTPGEHASTPKAKRTTAAPKMITHGPTATPRHVWAS